MAADRSDTLNWRRGRDDRERKKGGGKFGEKEGGGRNPQREREKD